MSLPSHSPIEMPGKTKTAVIILWIGAALGICFGIVSLAAINEYVPDGGLTFIAWVLIISALLNAVFAIAIQKRQNWARITTIVLCAIGGAVQAVSLFTGDPTALVGLALNIVIIVMLASEDSKAWCGA